MNAAIRFYDSWIAFDSSFYKSNNKSLGLKTLTL